MATKSKLGPMHTAGIFSDMTVDGPEIGTLVVIVDRAKNLPNRKTIGKQDPYCAARLGKEARKTETDRRGGQTPRWDQELRFKVHDSPDYYQLKVSVFNDDKKTDLIGETWISLKEVVVPGGGQNDLWHNLSCKGKYAGEIRIEITYYDTRQKQDKVEKAKQAGTDGVDDRQRDSLKGPRQPAKAPVKRRPLPSDPVTGEPAPTAIPDHVRTPIREHQQPDHNSPQSPQYRNLPPTYVPNQSPLQSVEYNTPPRGTPQQQAYTNSPDMRAYAPVSSDIIGPPGSQPPYIDRFGNYDGMAKNDFTPGSGMLGYNVEEESIDPRSRYDTNPLPYELPHPDDFGPPPSPGGPPPPPPAHGSRHGSNQVSPAPATAPHGSYGFPSNSPLPNAYKTPSHEMHRNSMPSYTRAQSYQPYTPPTNEDQFRRSANTYQENPPRHHSYDSGYTNDYRSMQPSVEDAPSSPNSGQYTRPRGTGSRISQYDDPLYEQVPSPSPLNLSNKGNASGRNSASTAPSHQYSDSSLGYSSNGASYRDNSVSGTSISSLTSYDALPRQSYSERRPSDDPMAGSPVGYGLPPLPPTLVPGMDPVIAREISERIYEEKRASQSAIDPPRGRYQNSQQNTPNRPHPLSYHEAAGVPFVPASASYDENTSRFSTAANAPVVKPRPISPNPRMPIRKSVSPSPGRPEERRLSGVPFGPDSYNALNPTLAASTSTTSLTAKYDPKEVDPDAKIITHDGREVDPSDHIPESNYAPLLEHKGPKYASQLPDRNYRPPGGSQPMAASGRRPFKQAGRPQSMAASSPLYMNSAPPDPSTPPNGRNRLQKKAHRMSAAPAPQSSPLAPINPYQDNSYSPRSLPRAQTVDFASGENYAPSPYGSSPGYRGSPAGPPPLPAKIPMEVNGPPPLPPHPGGGGGDPWALLEEMKNIDLGGGRSRRRQY